MTDELPDTLTGSYADEPQSRSTLIEVAEKTIVRDEFVIGYESLETEYLSCGYITVWIKFYSDGSYFREVQLSGGKEHIRERFGRLAEGSGSRVERFIEHAHS